MQSTYCPPVVDLAYRRNFYGWPIVHDALRKSKKKDGPRSVVHLRGNMKKKGIKKGSVNEGCYSVASLYHLHVHCCDHV